MKKSKSFSFIFFGEDVFSLAVLQSLLENEGAYDPLAVIMLDPISVSGKRLIEYCHARNIPIIKTKSVKDPTFLLHFEGIKFDFLISAHFQRIIPKILYVRARVGALNLHPSLLPLYRGMSPQHWPIVFGDSKTGVTVHVIEEGVDAGPIVKQVQIPLGPDTYIHELQKSLLLVYRTIMVDAIKNLIAGNKGIPQPKVDPQESYFHKIQNSDMQINTGMEVKRVYGLIRAFSFPYSGARFENMRIMRATIVDYDVWLSLKSSFLGLGLHKNGAKHYLFLADGALELQKWIKI